MNINTLRLKPGIYRVNSTRHGYSRGSDTSPAPLDRTCRHSSGHAGTVAAMDRSHDLLSPTELATLLGVTTVTLRRWRQAATGPPWSRIGPHLVRYERTAVQKWLATRESVKQGAS